MQNVTLAQLDKIEKMLVAQQKKISRNLLEMTGQNEDVVFCVYHEIKTGLFLRIPDLTYLILTNFRIIHTDMSGVFAPKVYMLRELDFSEYNNSAKWIDIYKNRKDRSTMFHFGVNLKLDKQLGEYMASEINKWISKSKVEQFLVTTQKTTAPANDTIADQLNKLSELHKAGILTDEEFVKAKKRVLG